MSQQAILEQMSAFFVARRRELPLEAFMAESPQSLIKDSLELVEFLVHLEETLGWCIEIGEVGEYASKSFAELAAIAASRFGHSDA